MIRKSLLVGLLLCVLFTHVYAANLVMVDWSYDEATETLTVTLEKEVINAEIRIFSSDRTLFNERINQEGAYIKSIFLEKADLTMTVDDYEAKEQQVFVLILATPSIVEEPPLSKCSGVVCGPGFLCTTSEYDSLDGPCCGEKCEPILEPAQGFSLTAIPFIGWVAVILLILAIAVLLTVRKTAPKKKRTHKKVKKK